MSAALNALATHGPVAFVLAGPRAHGFVVDSFCKSYEPHLLDACGLGKAEDVPASLRRFLLSGLHSRVSRALRHGRLLMAVALDEPDIFLGYALVEESEAAVRVHYVYVLAHARRKGLARALVETAVGDTPDKARYYSHHTPAGVALTRRFGLLYHPKE